MVALEKGGPRVGRDLDDEVSDRLKTTKSTSFSLRTPGFTSATEQAARVKTSLGDLVAQEGGVSFAKVQELKDRIDNEAQDLGSREKEKLNSKTRTTGSPSLAAGETRPLDKGDKKNQGPEVATDRSSVTSDQTTLSAAKAQEQQLRKPDPLQWAGVWRK